ncbi:DeoR/GlpR transcriptional regulator [Klebsiella oxytoca]|nr:DeoR/GlpR transcriptional regulator [Klebsiella oxytoca]HEL9856831.1 DeoR/GlpR transcriptional regulator [Klebsiella pneumoniae]
MNPLKRRKYILDQVAKSGEVSVIRLSEDLNVTSETIRRDLSALDDEGKLTKIHGGAIVKQIYHEDAFLNRLNLMRDEKKAIGKAAAGLLSPHDTVYIDSCTTNLIFAEFIPSIPLTVITNSMLIAEQIKLHNPQARAHVLGGEYSLEFKANLGLAVLEQINSLHADICFTGAAGITPENGVFVKNMDEGYVCRAMLRMSRKKVVLADSSKFWAEGVMCISSIETVDTIVTDNGVIGNKKYSQLPKSKMLIA